MKKKHLVLGTVVVALLAIISGMFVMMSGSGNKNLKIGTYYSEDGLSYVQVDEDGVFYYAPFVGGNRAEGTYNIDGTTLMTDAPTGVHPGTGKFMIMNDKLVYVSGSWDMDGIDFGTTFYYDEEV